MKLVEAFAGSLALSAWATGASSLIGYMGAKRVLAPAIAAAIGIERGQIEHFIGADAGPWGDFWAHFSAHGLAVADRFERWAAQGREMPTIWTELVNAAPPENAVERLSQFLVLQSRTASAAPVWWDADRGWLMAAGGATCPPGTPQQAHAAHLEHPSGKDCFTPTQRGRHSEDRGRRAQEKGTGAGRRSGIVNPFTIATRIRALHHGLAPRLTAHHGESGDLLKLLPNDLTGYIIYLDPPYVGCTRYAALCAREKVLEMALAYRARGAIVVISEGEPMPLEGWHTVDLAPARVVKRWTAKQRGEWLTMNRPPAKRPAAQLTLWTGEAA